MTRERLEGLSTAALIRIAEQSGLHVPPGVDRVLLVDLILEIEEEDQADHEQTNNGLVRVEQKKYDLPLAPITEELGDEIIIPEGYPQTRIVLLVRDPFWAFAYWDLKPPAVKPLKKEANGDCFFLRVQRLGNSAGNASMVMDNSDIQVKPTDRSWYINIPHQDFRYRVELVQHTRSGDTRLGVSNTVRIPRAVVLDSSDQNPDGNQAILLLSGILELGIKTPEKPIPQRINPFEEEAFIP
jgi:uncharacterized protein